MNRHAFRHPAISASVRQSLLMGLLVLAVLVRGLIPAGYMPGGAQGAGGLFPLELCSADNTVKTILMDLTGGDAVPDDAQGDPNASACVFSWLGNAVAADATPTAPVFLAQPGGIIAAAVHSPAHLRFVAGAPLGSRAPPLA